MPSKYELNSPHHTLGIDISSTTDVFALGLKLPAWIINELHFWKIYFLQVTSWQECGVPKTLMTDEKSPTWVRIFSTQNLENIGTLTKPCFGG